MGVCQDLALQGFADYLVYPTGCNYHFYLWFFAAILLIVVWNMLKEDDDKGKDMDMVSTLAATSLGLTSVAAIGTLVESADGLPVIQSDILLYMLAFTIVFVLIWIFTKE